jgi:hypothetical protein
MATRQRVLPANAKDARSGELQDVPIWRFGERLEAVK